MSTVYTSKHPFVAHLYLMILWFIFPTNGYIYRPDSLRDRNYYAQRHFFSAKHYDIASFSKLIDPTQLSLYFHDFRLTDKSAQMAKGCEVVCALSMMSCTPAY